MEGLDILGYIPLLASLVVVLPLFSFIFILLSSKGRGANLALINISISFLISVYLFLNIWNQEPVHKRLDWFAIADVSFQVGVLLNNLSVLMMVLVTGIAVLVHIYSQAYMKDDPNIHRYWAYLGLFCSSMLGLVIADNLLLIYIFWELVGFSSFLLIGFWFTKPAASQAAKKAFIMNRIGDLGLLLGVMIIYLQFNTFDLVKLFAEDGLWNNATVNQGLWINGDQQMPIIWLSIAGLAFFLGAMAKSAQFPLHTWLPDAMEGPTSVSSLIHAATMVAAGVFLIARIYPVFDPLVLNVMTCIGAFTAFMAASIALTQNDIKRILAYSTISQLGFMVMALGIGAYSESIFHLVTHAFFKCLLFLAAGAVIHQLHHAAKVSNATFDYQDVRLMGGLRKQMPITFICMCIASAALMGLPLSSGYLSKDAILISAFEWATAQSGIFIIIPYLMVLTSWLTVFYISRLIFKVFYGNPKEVNRSSVQHTHEAPGAMRYVLIILALFCSFAVFSVNPFSHENSWLFTAFQFLSSQKLDLLHRLLPLVLNLGSLALIYFSYHIYVKRTSPLFSEKHFWFRLSKEEWYFNELYSVVFTRPIEKISALSYRFDRKIIDGFVSKLVMLIGSLSTISDWFDRRVIDGLVNSAGTLSRFIGQLFRNFQSGKLQHYFITMLFVVLSFFIISYLL